MEPEATFRFFRMRMRKARELIMYILLYVLKLAQALIVCSAALLCTSMLGVRPPDTADGLIEVQMKHLGLDTMRRSDLWVNVDDGSVITLLHASNKPVVTGSGVRVMETNNGILLGVMGGDWIAFGFFFEYYIMLNGHVWNMHTMVGILAFFALLMAIFLPPKTSFSSLIFTLKARTLWFLFAAMVFLGGSLFGVLVSIKLDSYSFLVVWLAAFVLLTCSFYTAFSMAIHVAKITKSPDVCRGDRIYFPAA